MTDFVLLSQSEPVEEEETPPSVVTAPTQEPSGGGGGGGSRRVVPRKSEIPATTVVTPTQGPESEIETPEIEEIQEMPLEEKVSILPELQEEASVPSVVLDSGISEDETEKIGILPWVIGFITLLLASIFIFLRRRIKENKKLDQLILEQKEKKVLSKNTKKTKERSKKEKLKI